MKSFLLILSFLILNESYSQNLKIEVTRQGWAGGACCVSGTDYKITVSGNPDTLNQVEIHYFVIDGHKFDINKPMDKNSKEKSFSYGFGYTNPYPYHLTEKDIQKEEEPKYEGCYLKITYDNRQLQIPVKSVTDLFYIAYP